jgi:hypothetical protein
MSPKPPPGPDANDQLHGEKFRLVLENTLDFAGSVTDDSGQVLLRYAMDPAQSPYSLLNLFRKTDFVVSNADGVELLRIRRRRSVFPYFELVEHKTVVGTIQCRNFSGTAYTMTLPEQSQWSVRMPSFSLSFWAESSSGAHLWILVGPSKRQWNVLFQPGVNSLPCIAGLAFIHRRWWCYG